MTQIDSDAALLAVTLAGRDGKRRYDSQSKRRLVEAGTEQQILAASAALINATRGEPGCIDFYLHQHLDDPTRFVRYENFVDRPAVDAHVASAHVAAWFDLVKEFGARNEYALYRRIGG